MIEIENKWLNEEKENICHNAPQEVLELLAKLKNAPFATPYPKTGYCRDCKWWKDSDGAFRRGIGAESQCLINREEVYEGNGYCYMFEPREGEE